MLKKITVCLLMIGSAHVFADWGAGYGSIGVGAQINTCPDVGLGIAAGGGAIGGPGRGVYERGPDGCAVLAHNYWDQKPMCYTRDAAGFIFRGATMKHAKIACSHMSHARGCHVLGCQ